MYLYSAMEALVAIDGGKSEKIGLYECRNAVA